MNTAEWEVIVARVNHTPHQSFVLLSAILTAIVIFCISATAGLSMVQSFYYIVVIWVAAAVGIKMGVMRFYQRKLFAVYAEAAMQEDSACQQRQMTGQRGSLLPVRISMHWLNGELQLVLTARS